MPITIAPLNTELTVRKVACEDKVKKHLESLGITIGTVLKILAASGGNVIVVVKDGRLALDATLASRIFVS